MHEPVARPSPTKEVNRTINDSPGYTLGSHPAEGISLRSLNGKPPRSSSPDDVLPPPNAVSREIHDRWNQSRTHMFRTCAAFYSLFLTGLNDATYGAVIPYIEAYYSLSYVVVSLIFLSPAVGYILSALLNPTIHERFGQRGVAVITPTCHIIAYIIISQHPPFPVLVLVFFLAGFGNGLADAGWNAWVGDLENPNQVLGVMHGLYGAGATLAPICATALIVTAHQPWFAWYYVMIGLAVLEALTSISAFWGATGKVYRESHPTTAEGGGDEHTAKGMFRTLFSRTRSARVIWLGSLFFLAYVGAEVALGGWIVVFMTRVRQGKPFESGISATGFWLGLTIGRFVLGFVTPRIGENLSISIYIPIAAGLQLLFWLVPSFLVSAIAVAFQGFFLGPLFPAVVVACTRLLPKRLHVTGIGFAAAFGGSGGAIFPFAIGAIAQAKGVEVLQPIILALLVAIFIIWQGMPRMSKKKD